MAKKSAREVIKSRLQNYGIDLDFYVKAGTEIFDMGSTGRGINFVPDKSRLDALKEQLMRARSNIGNKAFASSIEDWTNATLKASFSFTKGDGFRELRYARDTSFDRSIYPEDGRNRPGLQSDPVFAHRNSSLEGGSLHIALENSACNIHIDESICFITGEAVMSPDSPQHVGNELGLRDKGMFGAQSRWDKLPYRQFNYSALVTGAYLGLYVGNGILGNGVRGSGGSTMGAAVAPLVLGLAGLAAGRFLPESTLKVMDHFSLVAPNSGGRYKSHLGLRFQADLGNFGPLQDVGMTVNMLYDVSIDRALLSGDTNGVHLTKAGSVSLHGAF